MNHQAPPVAAALLAALPLGVAAFDAEGGLVLSNPALTALAGGELPPGLALLGVLARLERAGLAGAGALAAEPPAEALARHRDGRPTALALRRLPGGFVLLTVEAGGQDAAEAEANRLGDILLRLSAGVARFGPDAALRFANPSYARLLGLPGTAALPGTPFVEIVRAQAEHGEFGPGDAHDIVAAATARDRSRPRRHERRRPDGTVLRVASEPLPEGGWLAEVTDISGERRAEMETGLRAALLEALLEALPVGVAVYGADQRVALVNPSYNAILHDSSIAPGETLRDILLRRARAGTYGPVDPEPHVAAMMETIGRPQQFLRRYPGERAVTHRLTPLPDGGHAVVVSDETALHAAQAEVRRRNDILTAMLEGTRHGIAMFDADGVTLAANALAAHFCGLPAEVFAPGSRITDLRARQIDFLQDADPDLLAFLRGRRDLDLIGPERYVRPGPDGAMVEVVTDRLPDGGFVRSFTDVTSLVRLEMEARERAQTTEALLENVRHALTLTGPDGRVRAASRLTAELLGEPDAAALLGRDFRDLVAQQARLEHPGDPAAAAAFVARNLALDRSVAHRAIRPAPGGRWFEVASDPTPDGGHASSVTDITALFEARGEAERRASELEALVSNSPQGLLLYDAQHRLVAGNALGAERAGLPDLAAQIGRTLPELIAAQLAAGAFGQGAEAEAEARRVLGTDRTRPHRARRRRPDGRVLEVASDPVPGGGFIASFADITELEEARAAAEARAAVLRATLDATQHAILLYGADRRVVAANDKSAALCGLPAGAAMQGMGLEEVLRLQLGYEGRWPGDLEALVSGYAALNRGKRIRYQRQSSDGRSYDVTSDPTEGGGFVVSIADVTLLADARMAAERQAATLRATLDAAPLGIVLYGADWRVAAANDVVADMVGAVSGRDMVGLPWDEVYRVMLRREGLGGDPEAVVAGYRALDRTRRQRYERRTADGRVIEVTSDPTPDGGFLAVVVDVTPLVAARTEAERQAQVLRITLEASRAAIALYDAEGRVVVANELMARHTCHDSSAGMRGRQLRDVLAEHYARDFPEATERAQRLDAALRLDRTRSHRYQRPGPDGRVYDVATDPAPGGGFVVSISDVTALVQAEAAAEARARTLAAMLDNIRHGICLFGADGRIVAANPMLHRMMALPPETFAPGQTLADMVGALRAAGEYGEGGEAEATAASILARDRTQAFRTTRRRHNGRVVDAVSDPTPDGGWVLTFTDVTEERAIRAELEGARLVAERASLAKSRFLATMSHELRTPLNAVIGFSEALRSGALRGRVEETAQAIQEAGQHLLSLIDDILDVSRAEVGALPVAAEPTDPVFVAEGAMRMMRGAAEEGGLRLMLAAAPGGTPALLADPRRLHQVLVNLLSNAIKFSPRGAVVALSVERDAAGVELAVADQGIGIATADIPRAFEPFTQLDSTLSRRFGGSGLGLHLSRVLAEAMGATLSLDSAPGEGTIARLRFPPACLLPPQALPTGTE